MLLHNNAAPSMGQVCVSLGGAPFIHMALCDLTKAGAQGGIL
jgi:hypothetical protein